MRNWHLVCLLITIGLVSGCRTETKDVSIIQLIATPEKYSSSHVRIIGYVRLEFEGNSVYLSKEDERSMIFKNGLWLDVPEHIRTNSTHYDQKICLIEGMFNPRDHGHMGLWSGAIENISRFEIWNSGNSGDRIR